MSEDDSDCTVGVQEDTDPSSPSILGGPAVETVEDGSISAVLPSVLPPSAPSHCNSQRIEEGTRLFVHNKADHCVSLSDVISEQEKLNHQLTSSCFTTQDVMVLEKKAKQIEKYLKDISLSNQDERKRIAESYSQLNMSDKESSKIKERLKNQLLALTSRQKLLLSCFTKQKVISKAVTQKKEDLIPKETSLQPQTNPMPPPPIDISDDDMQSSSVRDDLSQAVTQSTITTTTGYCQPVSLDALVNHKYLQPGKNCLSCVLMGCSFKASLMDNGSIEGSTGKKFLLPQQWVNDCWLTLGHTKRITRKHAYKNILYEFEPLMNLCESYNQKQVNSYKKHSSLQATSLTDNDITITTNNIVNNQADDFSFHLPTASTSITCKPFNITEILSQGMIVEHQPLSEDASLDLPAEFWWSHCHDVPANVIRLIDEELMF